MNYELVKATNKNIDELKYYKRDSILRFAENLSNEEKNKIEHYIDKEVPNSLNNYKIIMLNNQSIGCISIKELEDGLLLDEIYIKENYRSKGIGSSVLFNILKSNKPIFLWVYKNNIDAIRLYKKLGFLTCEETDNRYYMKHYNGLF